MPLTPPSAPYPGAPYPGAPYPGAPYPGAPYPGALHTALPLVLHAAAGAPPADQPVQ